MTLLIIAGIIAVLVSWVISVQRTLVSQEELCSNALSQIGVQQASRWDALTALVELTKGYSEHEYNTLKDVIALRKPVTGTSTAAEANAQENLITQAMSHIMAVREAYPDLKANENFQKTMDSVNVYENQVRTSRMVYNDSVTKFNRIVRQIPSSIVASMLGFGVKDYLNEAAGGKDQMPSMKF